MSKFSCCTYCKSITRASTLKHFITHDIFIHFDKALLAPKYSGVSSLEVLRPLYILDPVLQSDAPPPHILDPLL